MILVIQDLPQFDINSCSAGHTVHLPTTGKFKLIKHECLSTLQLKQIYIFIFLLETHFNILMKRL